MGPIRSRETEPKRQISGKYFWKSQHLVERSRIEKAAVVGTQQALGAVEDEQAGG